MTKKHFIELADVIRTYDAEAMTAEKFSESFPSGAILALADFCARQNPRFNRERWLGYIAGECGPGGGVTGRKGRCRSAP
jgi:hypothetical protein